MLKTGYRFLCFLLFFLFAVQTGRAQMQNNVKWSFSMEQNGQEAVLTFKARIVKGYHIYSQFTPPGGPASTVFEFEKSSLYTLDGKVSEGKPHVEYDDVFGVDVWSFGEDAVFRQKIKLNTDKSFKIEGRIDYQVCDDKACIYADTAFVFNIKGSTGAAVPDLAPVGRDSAPTQVDTASVAPLTTAGSPPPPGKVPEPSGDVSHLEPGCGDGTGTEVADKSYWGIFIAGMIGGLLALLTPCVFPMIPLTVSFFTKRSPTRSKGIANALIYSVSIILIYVILGFLVT
ncbi:MAG: thiol:disulfide interchange protein, partial [Bacteroidia bacterium]|nr:thiol:disulfide interchange protein [Bacteroidia bacterium]